MSEVVVHSASLPPISPEVNAAFEAFGSVLERLPQLDIRTEHHLHAGVYSRTLYVPAGTFVMGLCVKVPTQLITCGHFKLTDGVREKEFKGFHVLDGSANRRAAVVTITDSAFTMLFATDAKTVEEAEEEFTDEPERLLTRKDKEKTCQVVGLQ